ncbi:MAG: FkbM family methyltransferase [Desulfobacteraceae bacterium]|nr:FkbM family methyltransferase [Desulfobacteraceae bacterium]
MGAKVIAVEPAFCKIDVEGDEFDVLQGLSRPIKAISFEFVSECPEYVGNLWIAKE